MRPLKEALSNLLYKLKGVTMKQEDNWITLLAEGDVVENIRRNSRLRGQQGRVTLIGKRYSNYSGGKHKEVDDIHVTWGNGETGRYLVPLAHLNLKLIRKQEKHMSNSNAGKFLVWTRSGSNPQVRHYTHGDATKEAERLAFANPGKEFYVVEIKSVSVTQSVVTRSL